MRKVQRLLLDTHVWVWLALGMKSKIPGAALNLIEHAGKTGELFVSIVSVWEIALLVARQRIILPMSVHEWISLALDRPEIKLIGLSKVGTVLDSVALPGGLHADPADRFLIATARAQRAALVTHDQRIIEYGSFGHVEVLEI